jgi:hypothetical protein
MRTVRDGDGTRYVLLEVAGEASLVRDPETGEQRHVPNADLERVEEESPLVTASRAVSEPVRRVLTGIQDERALGLLLEIDARGAASVRALLEETDLCGSDLHGLLAEFRAAGLVTESRVGGERGYGTTDVAETGLARLRDGDCE